MDNKQLSICMPSNRNFIQSKESISSAIGFCEANNANLVISDNSCDTIKNDFWNKIAQRITWKKKYEKVKDNLFATVKDGQAMFARNKGQMANPLDLNGIIKMFTGHASALVEETYIFAAKDLAEALPRLKDQSLFMDGKSFINMELIYSKNPNVIYYDRDIIQFHGMKVTDGKGNIIGEENLAADIVKALKELKADVQKTFTIIPPQILKLGKDINFDEMKRLYIDTYEGNL